MPESRRPRARRPAPAGPASPVGAASAKPPAERAAVSGAADTAAATAFVIYAKDKDRVAEFYRRALSLEVSEWEDGFTLLTGAGVEISVVQMPEALARQVILASPPALREGTPLKAAFRVSGFEAVRAAAEATGGGLKPAAAEWSWRGSIHLDGHDPEGNVVQFRRPAA